MKIGDVVCVNQDFLQFFLDFPEWIQNGLEKEIINKLVKNPNLTGVIVKANWLGTQDENYRVRFYNGAEFNIETCKLIPFKYKNVPNFNKLIYNKNIVFYK